jgi:hypothetical protein
MIVESSVCHHERRRCTSCGNVATCRCSAPKVDVEEVCFQCKEKSKELSGKYAKDRLTRAEVEKINKVLSTKIKKHTKLFQLCGSYRRGKQEVGDIDYVVTDCKLEDVLAEIQTFFKTLEVSRQGESVMTVVLQLGKKEAQVEFLNVKKDEFGSALIHSTGSGEFNQGIRGYAKSKGLLLNQHGLFVVETKKKLASETEDKVFMEMGLFTIPPERRSDPWPKLKKEFMRDLTRNNYSKKNQSIDDVKKTWSVKSKSRPDKKHTVTLHTDGRWTCTCEWHYWKKVDCSHIKAVKTKTKK